MSNSTAQVFTDHLQVLFGTGTCAVMTEGQLLERFSAGLKEGGELAFEALVMRHGPMVMRVCRNMVGDPNDVRDAFQAVFLVLARRASAIRDLSPPGAGFTAWQLAWQRVPVQAQSAVTFGSGERTSRRRRSLQSFRTVMKRRRRSSGLKAPRSSTTN